MTCFRRAAEETLTPDQRDRAMAKANHMTHAIRTGLFPFHGMPGGPSATA
jgi:predicted RNA-binding protein associated with RNAse of E/G family